MKPSTSRLVPLVVLVIAGSLIMLAGPMALRQMAYAVEAGRLRAAREQLVELSKQDTLSPLFRAVSSVVQPAVVEIRITRRVQAPLVDQELEELMRRHFGESSPFREPGSAAPARPREFFARGLGSGVIVDAAEGYVLTNHHVVAGAEEVAVILHDGRKIIAEWVRTDKQTDLAVVKINADQLIDAPLGDSDELAVGDWVLAIGSPRGLQRTVTAGIVSAKGRHINGPGTYEDTIQTDAAINRGNSGGPLVNMRGEVIGINNAIASTSGGNEGISFAISSNMAREVMEQLIENGTVVRGFLGVAIQDIDDGLAKSFSLPDSAGALILTVQPGSPAEKAGLQVEDFIVSVAGEPVRSVMELRSVVAHVRPGEATSLEAYRGGEKVTFEVELVAQPVSMAERSRPAPPPAEPTDNDYGLEVADLTDSVARRLGYSSSVEGVVVTEVSPVSDAAEQGVRAGMVITHVGQEPATTAEQFAELLDVAGEDGIRLRILAGPAKRYVFIEPFDRPEQPDQE